MWIVLRVRNIRYFLKQVDGVYIPQWLAFIYPTTGKHRKR